MSTVGVCFSFEADNKKQRKRRKGKQDKDKKGGGDKEKTTVCMCFFEIRKEMTTVACFLVLRFHRGPSLGRLVLLAPR